VELRRPLPGADRPNTVLRERCPAGGLATRS
jgi:hypothetical protein